MITEPKKKASSNSWFEKVKKRWLRKNPDAPPYLGTPAAGLADSFDLSARAELILVKQANGSYKVVKHRGGDRGIFVNDPFSYISDELEARSNRIKELRGQA